MKIIFKTLNNQFEGELNNTLAAREIFERLPVEAVVSKWGEEIYFDLGFKVSADYATMEVETGDLAYWPQGKCLCIFYGLTPASTEGKPVPASPVVIVGKTNASPERLRRIELGETITVSRG